jgi:hypothetical protein
MTDQNTNTDRARKATTRTPRAATEPDKPKSSLDLDALEREGAAEPFTFTHAGRQYTLNDPQEQDWQQLMMAASNPLLALRLLLPEKDKDAFFETPLPTWKLRALIKAYREHYGVPEEGESAGLPL